MFRLIEEISITFKKLSHSWLSAQYFWRDKSRFDFSKAGWSQIESETLKLRNTIEELQEQINQAKKEIK